MAAGALTLVKTPINGSVAAPTAVTVSTADGAYVTVGDGASGNIFLVVTATAESSVTIKGGDGVLSGPDYTHAFSAAGSAYLAVDTGRFLITTGTNKGKIKLAAATAAVTVQGGYIA